MKLSINLVFWHIELGIGGISDDHGGYSRPYFYAQGMGSNGNTKPEASVTFGLVTTNADTVWDLAKEYRVGCSMIDVGGLGYETITSIDGTYTGSSAFVGIGVDNGEYCEITESKELVLPWDDYIRSLELGFPVHEWTITKIEPAKTSSVFEQNQNIQEMMQNIVDNNPNQLDESKLAYLRILQTTMK